jgi:signal transduction histidine kinase
MRRLISDLQDAERARRGDLTLERAPFDLRSVVIESAATFRARAQEHGVTLSKTVPSIPVVVAGDVVRLQQVLSNVL